MTYSEIAKDRSLDAVQSMETNKIEYPSLKDMDIDVYDAARMAYLCLGDQERADFYSSKIGEVRMAGG